MVLKKYITYSIKMTTYQFGIPGVVIWSFHILMGLWFVYVGRMALNEGIITRNTALILVVLGALAALYHAHIALYEMFLKTDEQSEMKLQAEVQQQIQEEKKENYYAGRTGY